MSDKRAFYTLIGLVLVCLCLGGNMALAQGFPFPDGSHDVHRIIVKFAEGSAVRLRDDALYSLSDANIQAAASALRAPMVTGVSRFFQQTESELDSLRQNNFRADGQPLPDLNQYYLITLDPQTPTADALAYITALNAMPSVETAYPSPLPAPPPTVTLQTRDITPDYAASQGYRNPAPQGIGIESAWARPGGKGRNIAFVDLEYAWNFDHEDYELSLSDLVAGEVYTEFGHHHGTAVLGEIIGRNNGLGVIGLVPNADTKVAASHFGDSFNVSQIIVTLTSQIPAGSVLLIEQQTLAPFDVTAACTSLPCDKYVPIEVHQDAFDAIQYAVAHGIIVVEVVGNGSMNLDHSAFGGLFKRTVRDSGAILVGAADITTHKPYSWANTGSRIDVYAWGGGVYTTGYGDLFTNGLDNNQDYTATFAGSSGASAIVTGAVIAVQGVAKANGRLLTPVEMRSLLRSTGTPQASGRKIGAMPNLDYALVTYLNEDGNLLKNKGFEDGATGWKVLSSGADVVHCKAGISAVGACAFRFRGNEGENSQLSQKVKFGAGGLDAGDTLTLSYALNADNNVINGAARLVISYADGTQQTVESVFAPTDGYVTQTVTAAIEKPVTAARILFSYRGTVGKAYVDDVKMIATDAAILPLSQPTRNTTKMSAGEI